MRRGFAIQWSCSCKLRGISAVCRDLYCRARNTSIQTPQSPLKKYMTYELPMERGNISLAKSLKGGLRRAGSNLPRW